MTKKSIFFFSVFAFATLLSISSCKGKKEVITSGELKLLVDESLEPVINDEISIFQSAYPDAKVMPTFKPENELVSLFLKDSMDVAIMARSLNSDEEQFFKKRGMTIRYSRIAIDGLALIGNKANVDTLIDLSEVIAVLKGEKKAEKNYVFDNANSSTVRMLKKLAGVDKLPETGIYSLQSNKEVIKYVSTHPNSIGIVGVNWLRDPINEMKQYVAEIRVLAVKNTPGAKGAGSYYLPSEENLSAGIYPLVRNVFIINCQAYAGLGTGFATWLMGERGQLIISKAGLGPHKEITRDINLK